MIQKFFFLEFPEAQLQAIVVQLSIGALARFLFRNLLFLSRKIRERPVSVRTA